MDDFAAFAHGSIDVQEKHSVECCNSIPLAASHKMLLGGRNGYCEGFISTAGYRWRILE